ncbi:hypothetical protein FMUND_3940 [Fusarium mundagurra]|uniref:Uncharacterized protein n=1 Tax=Fusarium mundagurra TaxID=1567541 RepID=A0A8H5Z170_9HYPO|nr:hypothetical protein FMUND_3940 [Fusarium mundagurra]
MLIQNLHREIIFLICESICPHCQKLHKDWPDAGSTGEIPPPPPAKERRQAIFNLSLVCKRWGYIAQKVLHHHFGYFETRPKAEFLFCRTLSENPELGKHVKEARIRHLSVCDWSLDEEWLAKALIKFSGVLDFPETSTVPDTSKWGDFIAPLILLQVPTLDQLSVQNGHLNEIMRKFRVLFVGKQYVLPQCIKSLLVTSSPIVNGTSTGVFLDLSDSAMGGLLSANRSIQALKLCNPSPQSIPDRLDLLCVRELNLSDSAFSRRELQLLISATGPLEQFEYYGLYRSELNGVTLQDICELLASKKRSLVSLQLETPCKAQHFTSAKRLINVSCMGFLVDGFWSPTDSDPVLEEHALLHMFPPNLTELWLDIPETTILGILDALVNYIISTCRDKKEDQALGHVVIRVLTSIHRESSEFPMAVNRSAWEEIKKRCQTFLKHGRLSMLLTCWKTGRGRLVSHEFDYH